MDPFSKRRPPARFHALMLRTSDADGRSHGGFQWPSEGFVCAPDWDLRVVCGGGLHGALRGEGDGSMFSWSKDALWQVVEVDTRQVVDLGGKVKVPRGWVIYSGDRETATRIVMDAHGGAVIGGTATAGDYGTATAGDYGTATAGDRGTATAGDYGTATAGDGGTATAGDGGTATAGHRGTATAGDGGTATARDGGELRIRWFDGSRRRCAVAYVGEDGIRPDVAYRIEVENGWPRLVEAE
jgi:hypothetical protein